MKAETNYLTVHPVGYLDLDGVEQAHGSKLAGFLRDTLKYIESDPHGGTFSFTNLSDHFERLKAEGHDDLKHESSSDGCLETCQACVTETTRNDFLQLILDQLQSRGAAGDIFFY